MRRRPVDARDGSETRCPASWPAGIVRIAPSSASMVFSATIGSRSGQDSSPKSGWSAKRAKPGTGCRQILAKLRRRRTPVARRAVGNPAIGSMRGRRRWTERHAAQWLQRRVFPRLRAAASRWRPASPACGTHRRRRPATSNRRAAGRATPRSAPGTPPCRFRRIAFTRPPPASRRSRSSPVPSPVPARRCARCGRRPAHARGSAPDDPAAVDDA